MASDEVTSATDERVRVPAEGESIWRVDCKSESLDSYRLAVVLLACEYLNEMHSDLPLVSARAQDCKRHSCCPPCYNLTLMYCRLSTL